ncbi:hypothetical protein [Variovorax sp. KK3]|uniref:hypothetical protein n=1 Tax=Variovorax sp. KK3 TaxID=1855728 RepID=UPI00097BD28F|nr:hypothetical protein [Variovorax sp. KK3]
MTETSISRELIENAMDAVQKAVDSVFTNQPAVPFHSNTDLLALDEKEREEIRRDEAANYRDRPTLSALSFCLTSAISLLAIAHSLIDQPEVLSPMEREELWKKLAADTKVAGRAAYRAALILSDPNAEGGNHP